MTALRLAIVGHGRMGRLVEALAAEQGIEVVAVIGREAAAGGIAREALRGATVAIEFTAPSSAAANVRACVAADCAVVCGTTGWDTERAAVTAEVKSGNGALLWAPNFSIGMHLFTQMVADAARRVRDAGFDGHLVETHHTAKQDAPSGTAVHLADAAARALGTTLPITSVRVGQVPGTHEVIFDAAFEQIRLTHEARDRRVFAVGAVVAARWLNGRRGVFSLDDVLAIPGADQ